MLELISGILVLAFTVAFWWIFAAINLKLGRIAHGIDRLVALQTNQAKNQIAADTNARENAEKIVAAVQLLAE